MKFLQVLFNIWVTQYWFCLFRFCFLQDLLFCFTLAKNFSFHRFKFETVHLFLCVIASIHVSRVVVISINALEKFIVQDSLYFGPILRSFLDLLFLIISKPPVIMWSWWGSAQPHWSVLRQKDTSSSTQMKLTISLSFKILFLIVLPSWYVTIELWSLFFILSVRWKTI